MSAEKQDDDAMRWMRQAESDLAAAGISRDGGKYEWACFQAQQAAEKAAKALWLSLDLDPWGHSVRELLATLPKTDVRARLADLEDGAGRLDKLYIPTRYPNGLPDVAPTDSYTRSEAETAIADASAILARVRTCGGIGETPQRT
jgi:HEPN domain-containing protein